MRKMTDEECRAFLLAGTRTGKLATVRADGRPHVAPVWFVFDGDDLVFTTEATSVKAANMRRDPRVSLCVDDERPPFAFALVEGAVTFSEDPTELRHWATRIGGRYMGEARAEEFGARNGVPGELLTRLHPTKLLGHTAVSA
ncbi:PPOX class F420-dependent oxidoreductase [Streptomyces specialis]|uniref:PPOX class F420-dependent oxidoreductase n=1 Tax=Streptomyces specialis TaxID=498367 RepID=UPI00073EEF5C